MLLTYLLGLGIVRHLGERIHVLVGFLGFLALFLASLGFDLLKDVLQGIEQTGLVDSARAAGRRRGALALPFAFFGLSVAVILGLLFVQALNPLAGGVFFIIFLLSFLAAEPRWGGAGPGYRELIHAFVAGGLTPLAACAFQAVPVVSLLPALTFPLVLTYLAAAIVAGFRTYTTDARTVRSSMVVRLGWQNALRIHQVLVAGAFLLLGLNLLVGVSWNLVLPGFLALPFAVVQFLWMGRIGRGGSTRWSFIVPLAKLTPALLAYLLLMPLFLD
jgi:1,4-dihydroxy-2-naphthoate octaprenyltransferase